MWKSSRRRRRSRACGGVAIVALLFVTAPLSAQSRGEPRPQRDVHFAPTHQAVADRMLQLAGVGPGDVVYDLGSGDGRILILAAQKYGARGVGIELDQDLVDISRDVAAEGGVADQVTIIEGDLFTADISKATVVTLYLSPSVNARLAPKLKRELRPGTRIVSHRFAIGDWPPDRVEEVDGTMIYLWTIPHEP